MRMSGHLLDGFVQCEAEAQGLAARKPVLGADPRFLHTFCDRSAASTERWGGIVRTLSTSQTWKQA